MLRHSLRVCDMCCGNFSFNKRRSEGFPRLNAFERDTLRKLNVWFRLGILIFTRGSFFSLSRWQPIDDNPFLRTVSQFDTHNRWNVTKKTWKLRNKNRFFYSKKPFKMLLVYQIVELYNTYLVATLANINFWYKLTILSSFSLTSLNVVVKNNGIFKIKKMVYFWKNIGMSFHEKVGKEWLNKLAKTASRYIVSNLKYRSKKILHKFLKWIFQFTRNLFNHQRTRECVPYKQIQIF